MKVETGTVVSATVFLVTSIYIMSIGPCLKIFYMFYSYIKFLTVDFFLCCYWGIADVHDAIVNSRKTLDEGYIVETITQFVLDYTFVVNVENDLTVLANLKYRVVLPGLEVRLKNHELLKPLLAILQRNRIVTSLNLVRNQIQAEGAIQLAEALKVNNALTSLNLYDNQIQDGGAIQLAQALKVNNTLTSLDLEYNEIQDEGAIQLAEALKVNNTLTSLYLGGNQIKDGGAIQLVAPLRINLYP